MAADLRTRVETLTKQELACMLGVAQLKRSKQISREINLAPKTVDAYAAAAVKKLGAEDRHAAARMLIDASRMPWAKSLSAFRGMGTDELNGLALLAARFPWPWPSTGSPTNERSITLKFLALALAVTILLATASAFVSLVIVLGDQL